MNVALHEPDHGSVMLDELESLVGITETLSKYYHIDCFGQVPEVVST
jgi:hypothetical protein